MKLLSARVFCALLLALCLGISTTSCNALRKPPAPAPSYPTPVPDSPSPPESVSYVQTLTDGNFKQMVKEAAGLRVAYFWASWCGPCRTMAPAVETVTREYKDQVMLGKLDVDANPTTRILQDVNSIPTFIFYKDGEIVHRSTGMVTEQYLRNIIQRLL